MVVDYPGLFKLQEAPKVPGCRVLPLQCVSAWPFRRGLLSVYSGSSLGDACTARLLPLGGGIRHVFQSVMFIGQLILIFSVNYKVRNAATTNYSP